jgi:hypothetical protein
MNEIKTLFCYICQKKTDHTVKELKSGHEYTCPVCKSIKYVPNEIKSEYKEK